MDMACYKDAIVYTIFIEMCRFQMRILYIFAMASNVGGGLQDLALVTSGPQADVYAPYMPIFQRGNITCRNFLDVDIDALLNGES